MAVHGRGWLWTLEGSLDSFIVTCLGFVCLLGEFLSFVLGFCMLMFYVFSSVFLGFGFDFWLLFYLTDNVCFIC